MYTGEVYAFIDWLTLPKHIFGDISKWYVLLRLVASIPAFDQWYEYPCCHPQHSLVLKWPNSPRHKCVQKKKKKLCRIGNLSTQYHPEYDTILYHKSLFHMMFYDLVYDIYQYPVAARMRFSTPVLKRTTHRLEMGSQRTTRACFLCDICDETPLTFAPGKSRLDFGTGKLIDVLVDWFIG